VVAAHPDDETLGAGGTIAGHVAAGDHVAVAVVTDGSASRAPGVDPDTIASRRRQEAEAAAAILGVERLVCLGLVERHWDAREARQLLEPLLAEAAIVYVPPIVDFHPEHVAVSRVVAELLAQRQLVRMYELGVPLTPVLANCVTDTIAFAELKARALDAYVTQRLSTAPYARLERYRALLYGLDAAEVFWQLPADAFARVTALGDWRDRRTPFRGIRPRPFTDPLAAIVGLKQRLALRRAALDG